MRITIRGKMKKKLATVTTVLAGMLLFTGCSSPSETASEMLSDVKPPQGFIEQSKKDNTVVFVALKDGKSTVDLKSFCGPLFDWAYMNQLTRFQLVDNVFELKDYAKDGTEMGKTAEENGPWVAACNSNFNMISTENKENNKNWDKDIMFFSESEKGVGGSATVSAGFEGQTKYVKVTVNFKNLEDTTKAE